jgi:hypothetical protein
LLNVGWGVENALVGKTAGVVEAAIAIERGSYGREGWNGLNEFQ